MSDNPIGDIVGRHDKAAASTAPETGSAATGGDNVQSVARETVEKAGGTVRAAEPDDPIAGLKSALEKERDARSKYEKESKREARERQKLAQMVSNYERRVAELESQARKPDPAAKENEYWSSPLGYHDKSLSELEQRLEQRRYDERVAEGKELARDRYEDFEEAEAAFLDAAYKNQSLWDEVGRGSALNLPTRVYKAGKKILAGGETSPMSEIEKLKAEIAELKAGRDGGQTSNAAVTAASSAPKPTIPRSNAGLRSSGVGTTTTWAGPTPINKVFGRQRSAR